MEKSHKKNNFWKWFLFGLLIFVYLLSFTIIVVTFWSKIKLDTKIEGIIFTFANPIKGANTEIVWHAVKFCLPRIFLLSLIPITLMVFVFKTKETVCLKIKTKKNIKQISVRNIFKKLFAIGSVFVFVFSFFYVDYHYSVIAYLKKTQQSTKIYEEYYVNPNDVNIRLSDENGKKKNLIWIYLESMETIYASKGQGGGNDTCYIPNLVNLANENLMFSNTTKLGGFVNSTGTTTTATSLLAQTSGIPYQIPLDANNRGLEYFSEKLTNIGDILNDFGYNQEFLCGSNADYAGRKKYFENNGNYKVFDYYTAIEENYIDKDYKVWWGYEDEILYKIAKDEILELSQNEQPFNFTMLTVDTHFETGYRCNLCGNNHKEETANIVNCADKQISNFVNWCKQQSFYEDTLIVITGDHPRMDKHLIVNGYQRTIYNCFINCDKIPHNKNNRTLTALDMFPTVLSAMGFEWDGYRLGFGVDLFSDQQTLAEQLTLKYLNSEFTKKSKYYTENLVN